MSAIRGYPSQQKLERTQIQFVTVEPVHKEQNGASVVAHQYVYEVGSDVTEAGSTAGKIVATAHAAMEGDVVRLTSGAQSGKEIKVVSVIADEIILAEDLPAPIADGVTFDILRHKYPLVEEDGRVKISGSFTTSEQAVAEPGDPMPTDVKVVGGDDAGTTRAIAVNSSGHLQVDVLTAPTPVGASTYAAQTDGSQKSQIVDAAGDIADVKLLSVNLEGTDKGLVTNTVIHGETTGLGGGYVDVKVTPSGALNTESTIAGLDAGILGQDTMANSLPVVIASDQTAIPVSMAAAPLPTDAATETTLSALNTKVPSNLTVSSTRLLVDGSGVTQPISGIVESRLHDANGTPITAAGSALRCYNDGGLVEARNFDGNGNKIFSTSNALDVHIASGSVSTTNPANGATGAAVPAQATQIGGTDGTTLRGIKTDANGELQIDVLSSALPSGAATESTLSAVSGQLPAALGQNTMANSLAVVLASDQAAIPVTASFSPSYMSVVDLLDASVLDTGVTNIPGVFGSPVQVVASLAAPVKALQIIDTTGAFIGLYTGGSGSEVLKLIIGPGSDQTIEHSIPSGTRISLRKMVDTAPISTGLIAINFLG